MASIIHGCVDTIRIAQVVERKYGHVKKNYLRGTSVDMNATCEVIVHMDRSTWTECVVYHTCIA